MKKIIYPLFFVIGLSACKKDSQNQTNNFPTTGNGNIIQDQSVVTNSGFAAKFEPFNAQDSTIVFGLMSNNKLSRSGYVFYFYESYTPAAQQSDFVQTTLAKQVRNGLPVFSSDMEFAFVNGIFNGPPPPWSQTVGTINLDTKSTQSLQNLRNIFIKADNAAEAYSIGMPDSTLVAQFGYYNVSQDNTPNYIKAWFVHPHHWPWPNGFFRDDSGAFLSISPLTHKSLNP